MSAQDGRTRVAHELRRHLSSARWTDSPTHGLELSTEDGIRLLELLGGGLSTIEQAELDGDIQRTPRWRWRRLRVL